MRLDGARPWGTNSCLSQREAAALLDATCIARGAASENGP